MNLLILGGNGYIGSKVTKNLVNKNHSIVCTKRSNYNLSRLEDIKEKVKWIPASIDSVEAVMQYEKFDVELSIYYCRKFF